jgi:hypothetical protein
MMLLKPGRQVTVSKLAGTWELSSATLPLIPAGIEKAQKLACEYVRKKYRQ